mmetsp:Transcript_109046/g.339855  ORF Transcript_109046/g.339855 Transcript_109046/m.339855 type:complete len:201 (+) Transcript_109046:84-686(+)
MLAAPLPASGALRRGSDRARRTVPPGELCLGVRNLPWEYRQEDLLQFWPPDGTYSYLCTPYNIDKDRIVGYAVLSFVSTQRAQRFMDRYHGFFLLERPGNNKTLDIKPLTGMTWRLHMAWSHGSLAESLHAAEHLPIVVSGTQRWRRERIRTEIAISAAMVTLFQQRTSDAAERENSPDAAHVPRPFVGVQLPAGVVIMV